MGNVFETALSKLSAFTEGRELLSKGAGPVQFTGCVESQKVHIMYQAGESSTRLVVSYDERQAMALLEDFRLFTREVYYFPAKDFLFYQADLKSNEITRARMKVFRKLHEGLPVTIVTTFPAVMNALPPFSVFTDRLITLSEGLEVELPALTKLLVSLGYERVGKVENPGEFAIHGGIIDIFDLTEENPFRIEFFDTEIDTIRIFSAESQISSGRVETVTIYPAAEVFADDAALAKARRAIEKEYKKNAEIFKKENNLEAGAALQSLFREISDELDDRFFTGQLERCLPYFFDNTSAITDYLPEGALICIEEPHRLREQGELAETEFVESFKNRLKKGLMLPGQAQIVRSVKEAFAALNTGFTMVLSMLQVRAPEFDFSASYPIDCQSLVSYQGNFNGLTDDLLRYKKLDYSVVLLVPSGTRGSRMAAELRDRGIRAYYEETPTEAVRPGDMLVMRGSLHKGFVYPMLKFVVLTEADIFGAEKKKKKKKPVYDGTKIRSFSELSVGDYVVHENYGIGIYGGVVSLTTEGVTRDYMKISYQKSGTLYVPVTNLDVVQKYAGKDARPPKINRLDSPDWNRTKSRVKAAVDEVADELVTLYAARDQGMGYTYGPDTVWQREFEEMFPYDETDDQLEAIDATKKDMESGKIMDRLICGDVGFGKTEIALRAAFKAVQDSKQVAYLVPTTILAEQHYKTFLSRLSNFPVRVDMLSRFRSAAEVKKTLTDLKKGAVDVLIGTHRILSEDVHFRDLGLLIIDEEQRFGVKHKEKIKMMKQNVDVLTLTATPIPRTLHMSMIGVRDMSLLTEPPEERLPIQTYVMEYSEELVREAISRELARSGQVYYIYNRVQDIHEVAAKIQALVPEANVDFAHGKMNERELESRMMAFVEGEIDVLVSTTIVETGLDIPNVNTIIVHDSERYGLSQLYQLRGRVGRSNRQAYAFIMHQKNRVLKENAEKRLEAIREYTELGSGIRIAMQDLEIRGAGAILGNIQSGHLTEVGYDLYCKMLSEAVKLRKGEAEAAPEVDTLIDVRADAYIPSRYIANESLKLEVYKKISMIENENDVTELEEELLDRYGEVPKEVKNLMTVSRIRAMARSVYITEIKGNVMEMRFRFAPDARVRSENIPALIEKMRGALSISVNPAPVLTYRPLNYREDIKTPVLDLLSDLLTQIKELLI